MSDTITTEKKPEAVESAQATDDKLEVKPTRRRKSKRRHVPRGKVYIKASYNNTIVSFSDLHGNILAQSSAGRVGFKGPKKSTPYAAGIIVKEAGDKVKEMGMKEVHVLVKGIGSGRDGAIRALNAHGFTLLSIRDITPMPHNGCRAKKPRRV